MKSELFYAARIGNVSRYRAALTNSESIDSVNEQGETSLMVACRYGYYALTQFIISRGANVTAISPDGFTAADYALQSNNPEVARLFGVTEASTFPSYESPYKKLTDNIGSIVGDIESVLSEIDFGHRPYILEDFTKIMLLATKGNEMKTLYKFAFALLTHSIVKEENDNIFLNSLNGLPEEEVIKIFIEFYDSQLSFFKKLESYNYEFTLNSFPLFDDDGLDKIKKAFYEFAEVVVKADGTVTKEETENLKTINADFLGNINSEGTGAENKIVQAGALKNVDSLLLELNDLIGLLNIKTDIRSLINIINANKMRVQQGLPQFKSSLHAVFMGPPGTGKTTVARILAQIYHSLGVLEQNNFIETDRSGLVAGYVGQTAIKTDKLVNDALNGVLFIDEAYALSRGGDVDFGQEAIETLLKRMEDHRDKLIVIVAGYEDEMNTFINSNPGLQSRFSRYFYFKDYDGAELTEIYCKMAGKAGFILTDTALTKATDLFTTLYENKDGKFGNARLARNIFEKSFEKHANRTATIAPITREVLITLEEADIPYEEFVKRTPG